MDRRSLVTAGVVLLLLSATAVSAEEIQIQGKSLFTFSREHFVVQSDQSFYKIEKKGLLPATVSKLEKSSVNNESVTVNIPRSKIDYIWPNLNSAQVLDMAIAEEPKVEAGRIVLRGILQVSFSEEYFLVQDQNSVYQITRSALSEKEIESFTKAGPGTPLVVAVSEKAIQSSWSFKQDSSRSVASIEEPDETHIQKSILTMRGTILYSPDSRFVIVQSGPTIYRLKRNGIRTKQPELLDLPASRVNLTVAVANIEAYW